MSDLKFKELVISINRNMTAGLTGEQLERAELLIRAAAERFSSDLKTSGKVDVDTFLRKAFAVYVEREFLADRQ